MMDQTLLKIEGGSFRGGARTEATTHRVPLFFGWIALPILIVSILLRFYSLAADPDWRLDWNPGLLTDEAFYMHNARNQVLFGHARLDEFNNMVLSPIIHFLHVGLFHLFGVGYGQGRLLSVSLGLLSLFLFYRIIRLTFASPSTSGSGLSAHPSVGAPLLALFGVAWLGFEHTYLLFNRMALLETPVAFFCLLSLYALAESRATQQGMLRWVWGLMAGIAAVMALATKITALGYLMALVILISFGSRRDETTGRGDDEKQAHNKTRRQAHNETTHQSPVLLGLALGIALWSLLWLLPNWAEWWHMQHFYINTQARPRTLGDFWLALQRAIIGERYGMSHFLFMHMPITWTFTLLLFAALAFQAKLRRALTPVEWIFVFWVLFGWLQMATIRVAPTRYTVAFMPAMVGMLIIALARWEFVREFLQMRSMGAWLARTLILAWVFYFISLLFLPELPWRGLEFPVMNSEIQRRFLGAALLLGGLIAYWLPPVVGRVRSLSAPIFGGGSAIRPTPVPTALLGLLCLFLLWNTHWYVDYFGKRTFHLQQWGRVLTAKLPPKSVIVGIAFETPFRYFFVFQKLCNWQQPLEERGATHVMLIGSDETHFRFWTNSANLSRWYASQWYASSGAIGLHSLRCLQGTVGPYKYVIYRVPEREPQGGTRTAGTMEPLLHLMP